MKKEKEQKKEVGQAAPKATTPAVIYRPNMRYAIIAAALAFALYANTIMHDYVLDDTGVIMQSQFVQQGLKGIGQIFKTDVWHFQNINLGYYRPLSLATFAIEHQFFGNNPHVGHFVNVLLYAITGFFLCLLLTRIFNKRNPVYALAISLLFIAHPIHTEVVANIKSRDEILAFLMLVIGLHVLVKAANIAISGAKRSGLLVLSGLFFYLGLLSKETALVGMLLVPLILFYSTELKWRQIAAYTAPVLIALLVFQFQKYLLLGTPAGVVGTDIINYPYANLGFGSKLATAFLLFAWSIRMTLVPYPLAYSYAYNQIPAAEWLSLGVIAGVLLAIGLVYFAVKDINKKQPVGLGLLVFGIALAPAMGFVLLRGGIFAERFLYIPVLGFSIAVVFVVAGLIRKPVQYVDGNMQLPLKGITVPLIGLAVLPLIMTITRNADWKDELTLLSHDVEVVPNNCQAHLHFGIRLIETGAKESKSERTTYFFQQGMQQLNSALQIDPHIAEAFYEKGRAFNELSANPDSAIYYYNLAIMERPNFALSYFSLGDLYQKSGNQHMASYYYNKGVGVDPVFTDGITRRDNHRKATGLDVHEFPAENNINAAEANADKKDFNFYNNMGQEYGKKGDYVNAIRCLAQAVEMNPASTEALTNLSLCYAMTKQYDQSIAILQKVLQIEPNNVTALNNLSILYDHVGEKGRGDEVRKKLELLKGR